MSGVLDVDVRGLVDAQAQLALLSLTPQLRRRLLNKVSTRIRTASRKRIRAQQNLDGSTFAPRQGSTKGKKKMEAGLGKLLQVTRLSPNEAVLGWRNALTRWVAGQQHNGGTERRTATQMRRMVRVAPDVAATEKQAKRLRQLGFTAHLPGKKKPSRPPVAWISQHMNYAKAGLLIRILRDGKNLPAKAQSWDIRLPKRQFLGAGSTSETSALIDQVLQQILTPTH